MEIRDPATRPAGTAGSRDQGSKNQRLRLRLRLRTRDPFAAGTLLFGDGVLGTGLKIEI